MATEQASRDTQEKLDLLESLRANARYYWEISGRQHEDEGRDFNAKLARQYDSMAEDLLDEIQEGEYFL